MILDCLAPRLYAYENFYSCRLSNKIVLTDQGYTPTKISTLVDHFYAPFEILGYTPTKISTLVDEVFWIHERLGYTPTKISTLVDTLPVTDAM